MIVQNSFLITCLGKRPLKAVSIIADFEIEHEYSY